MAFPLATQEPVIVENGLFLIERPLGDAGTVTVHVGDIVSPDTSIGTASARIGRPVTIHLAQELGVAPDAVARHVTKPVGSRFQQGEVLARARRGLRTVTAQAPLTGVLSAIDPASGAVTMTPEAAPEEVRALVHGEVISIAEGRSATIRSSGTRVRGTLAVGSDAAGPIQAGVDRADRELTPDSITADMRDAVVLGGMTVGTAAIRRLAEVGARGVIVGSIAEADIRRVAGNGAERPAHAFWATVVPSGVLKAELTRFPLTIFVTEGFGRRPMAAPIFRLLAEHEGDLVSLVVPKMSDAYPAYPELYLSVRGQLGDDSLRRVEPAPGLLARLVDPQHLGTVVTCQSGIIDHPNRLGLMIPSVEVELGNGARRVVPAVNLEILVGP